MTEQQKKKQHEILIPLIVFAVWIICAAVCCIFIWKSTQTEETKVVISARSSVDPVHLTKVPGDLFILNKDGSVREAEVGDAIGTGVPFHHEDSVQLFNQFGIDLDEVILYHCEADGTKKKLSREEIISVFRIVSEAGTWGEKTTVTEKESSFEAGDAFLGQKFVLGGEYEGEIMSAQHALRVPNEYTDIDKITEKGTRTVRKASAKYVVIILIITAVFTILMIFLAVKKSNVILIAYSANALLALILLSGFIVKVVA